MLGELSWVAILVWIGPWIFPKFWLLLFKSLKRYDEAYFEKLRLCLNLIIEVCISVFDKATHVFLCNLMVF